MTRKEEMLSAIRECAAALGHCPTLAELKKLRNIGVREVRRYFTGYAEALRAAGFDPHGQGYAVTLDELFADWARVARRVGKLPTLADYKQHGRYSVGPLIVRFGGWTEVPRGMLQHARETGLHHQEQWRDVLEMIEKEARGSAGGPHPARPKSSGAASSRAIELYGRPLTATPAASLAHAPTNEMGVVCLFGMMAGRLGFVITRIQSEFPDCELLRQVEDNQWQRLRAEFEFESRNFLTHRHKPEECDLIVCWLHNWPECPLEVLELSAEFVG